MRKKTKAQEEPTLPLGPSEVAQPIAQPWWRETARNVRRLCTIGATVFALFLSWHVMTGRNGLNSWQQKNAEEKALAAEIQQLTEENAHLRQHVERLKADPAAIEDDARRRLRYTRPNEVIYKLPENSTTTAK